MKKVKWLCSIALVSASMLMAGHAQAADQETANTNTNQVVNTTAQTSQNSTATPATTENVQNINQVVKITYNGAGKVALWDNYGNGKKVINYLSKNTSWKAYKVADVNGHKWYNLGGNQWVDGSYITVVNEDSKPTTPSVSENTGSVTAINEIVKITYNGAGKVALWDHYGNGKKVINYLSKNTSWKAYKVADVNGHKWYNLGGNQWVDGSYVTISNSTAPSNPVISQPQAGWKINNVNTTITVRYSGKGQVAVWSTYGAGKRVLKYVSNGTSWKVYKEAIPTDGYVWYNLGGNQWIVSEYASTQKISKNGVVTSKQVAAPSTNTGNKPFADPATLRTPMQWQNSSETKAYPNLRNVKNLWIRVSILGNRTYVMSGNTPVYTMYSSAGKFVNGKSLTPTGTYYVQGERGLAFSSARYWVSWKDHGVYLFHSTPTNGYNGPYILSEAVKLGSQPLSHGCIRLTVSDAKWFYNQLPTGTKVVIANN